MENKKNNHKKSNKSRKLFRPKIGITIGDFNGIGPEVIIKALNDNRINNICTPIIYGSSKVISKYKRILDLDLVYNQIGYHNNYNVHEQKVNIVNCWTENVNVVPGKVTEEAGSCSLYAIKEATEALRSNFIDAVVTAPINKHNIQSAGFEFPGHTEYYTEAFDTPESLMLLTCERLRVGVVTGHIPISQVAQNITKENVATKLAILIDTLKRDFGISKPKVAVLGLNPHAGENGALGSEDDEIIRPVVSDFKNRGNLVYGPFPSDGFFGMMAYKKFDGVLAMYHDQGLIPFKTIAFEDGVNYTAGLPIVRTSPDHGTAYNIAGKNIADPTSLLEAIFLACDIVRQRKELEELEANQLKPTEILDEKINEENN